ncbi:hypothetical protein [Aeromonas sp. MdU4]
MNQSTDVTPVISDGTVPHDPTDTTEQAELHVIQLDVIDLAEPDDDY